MPVCRPDVSTLVMQPPTYTNLISKPGLSDNDSLDQSESNELPPDMRDRCNTWPKRRPDDNINETSITPQPSTLLHEHIEEEDEEHADLFCDASVSDANSVLTAPSYPGDPNTPSPATSDSSLGGGSTSVTPNGPPNTQALTARQLQQQRTANRRNAWGNMSYADLITQAILSAPDNRMTLSQIYDWMVQHVPYFRDKGDSNSSAGWKNSIRHNLSLHSRFMRIQNEGAGKSSWWVLNPDAKAGKVSRRRAQTIESANKTLERKRGRVKKKVEQMRAMGLSGSQVLTTNGDENGDQFNTFRGRSDSTLSNYSTPASRLSPSLAEEYHPAFWPMNDPSIPPNPQPVPGELIDMATTMRLSNVKHQQQQPSCYAPPPTQRHFSNGCAADKSPIEATSLAPNGAPNMARFASPIKCEPGVPVKLEPINLGPNGQASMSRDLPSYQELYPHSQRGGMVPTPMLREALQPPAHNGSCYPMVNGINGAFVNPYVNPMGQQQQRLPNDLTYDDSPSSWQPMDVQCDIDQVLRHEMSVAGKVDFSGLDHI